jgi:hypothetical protein
MEKTHPKLYDYVLSNLGLQEIIDFMNEKCNCNIKTTESTKQLTLF